MVFGGGVGVGREVHVAWFSSLESVCEGDRVDEIWPVGSSIGVESLKGGDFFPQEIQGCPLRMNKKAKKKTTTREIPAAKRKAFFPFFKLLGSIYENPQECLI